MSYKGTIQQIGTSPKGELKSKPKLFARISPVTGVGDVRIRCTNAMKGEMEKQGGLGGSVKRLSVRYVFLAAVVRFCDRFTAVLGTAPATEMESDTAIQASKEAPLSADLAKEIKVDSAFQFSVFAGLVAYVRTPFVYMGNVLMHSVARLIAADGAVAKGIRNVTIGLKVTVLEVASTIARSKMNRVLADSEAVGSTVPTVDTTASGTTVTTGSTATGTTGSATDVEACGVQKTVAHAGVFTWFLPEYADGTLSIFQIFSGVQSADAVEVDLEADSVYWANNFSRDGVLSLVFAQTEPQNDNELKVI